MVAHNGSGFDIWIILFIRPSWCKIVKMIKTGKVIFSLKIYKANVNVNNKSRDQAQKLTKFCSAIHLSSSLKKLGKTYSLQKNY